jgi:hypothetical protein
MNNHADFYSPNNFIEIFVKGIVAAEAQGETIISLSPKDTRYLFEFYRIFKVGGIASPYATIEWPGVQIPHALMAILQNKGINITLINNDGEYHEAPIYSFKKNPAGRGLDFDENPDQKSDFLRYAIQLNCINPIRDIIKSPLPPLEEIAGGASIQFMEVGKHGT